MNRSQRRALKKQMGEEAADKVAEKIFQFDKLPESCSACAKDFDKKDKDMVQSWSVVVKQEVVRLFGPSCLKKTKEILNENC